MAEGSVRSVMPRSVSFEGCSEEFQQFVLALPGIDGDVDKAKDWMSRHNPNIYWASPAAYIANRPVGLGEAGIMKSYEPSEPWGGR